MEYAGGRHIGQTAQPCVPDPHLNARYAERVSIRDTHIRSRLSDPQAAAAERVIEKTALDRAWVLTRLRENVERSMQVTPLSGRCEKAGY